MGTLLSSVILVVILATGAAAEVRTQNTTTCQRTATVFHQLNWHRNYVMTRQEHIDNDTAISHMISNGRPADQLLTTCSQTTEDAAA